MRGMREMREMRGMRCGFATIFSPQPPEGETRVMFINLKYVTLKRTNST